MLVRLMDMLKEKGINSLFTALTHDNPNDVTDLSEDAVSSLSDTWIKLRNDENKNSRFRELIIIKSRGMGHENGVNKFSITDKGIVIINENANANGEPAKDRISLKKKLLKKNL